MKWTADEIATLTQLWGTVRAKEIAERLGKTTCAVIGKAYRMDLPMIPEPVRIGWIKETYWSAQA